MKARYRIVYCEGNLDGTIGGSYFSLLFLVAGLDREQFEPIVAFRRSHALLERFRDTGVETIVIPPPKPVSLGLARDASRLPSCLRPVVVVRQGINFLKIFVWDGLKLAWWLRKCKADIVHLNNSVTRTHSWMLAAKILGIPCITHERGMNIRYSSISRYFAPRLAKVICISEAVRGNLIEHEVTKDNLVVVHNGIDPDSFRPKLASDEIRRQLDIPTGSPVIGMVGNIRAWKGQDVVVKAVGRLKARFPDIVCVFVGEATAADSRFSQYLATLSTDLKIQGNLRFTGYQSDVADYVNIMDVVVHASVDPEPFGRVLIEAMSLGKPVIGACAGAVPEILDDPKSGLTFPPGDDAELARLANKLLTNTDLARQIGAAARHRVDECFGIDRNIRGTERVYVELMR